MANMSVTIVGNGLAAAQCALALCEMLPSTIQLTLVRSKGSANSDILYGSLTSPDAYQHNLQLQVSEPDIMLQTNTTFSYGTRFISWGKNKRDWMQCFHQPLNAVAGVQFHQIIRQHKAALEDYLISAQAAKLGRFAHPPVDKPESALSRAEYAYHFNPDEWAALFFSKLNNDRINIVDTDTYSVAINNHKIDSITLANGQVMKADLFVDCTGTSSKMLSAIDNTFDTQACVAVANEVVDVAQTGPSYRQVQGSQAQWQSVTPLQNRNLVLSVSKQTSNQALQTQFALGKRPHAWIANCVGIGHAAYALEPLTPAPHMLLTKDIMRLAELIPLSGSMALETKEYNRRYNNDLKHAELFQFALYDDNEMPSNPELTRKLQQFGHRGVLANFDLEPFHDEDWLILHFGMGRSAKYYDPLAEQINVSEMAGKLLHMRKGIEHLAQQIPPHHIYLEKFLQYLREKHVNH